MGMRQYLDMLSYVLSNGTLKKNRTGIDTLSVFGYQFRHDLQDGFPLLTTKRMFTRGIIEELLWFLRGSTNNNELTEKNVHIWDQWADSDGDLGPIYGKQWRKWMGSDGAEIDQIAKLVDGIKKTATDPTASIGRRLIVSAWNPADLPQMKLAPCHCFFQCDVTDGRLSTHLYQRSADLFLGVPFNIASSALLTHMLAHVTGLEVGEFVHTFGDLHVYVNHREQVEQQLLRYPMPLPKLVLNRTVGDIDSFRADDFTFQDYKHHPAIKAEVAV